MAKTTDYNQLIAKGYTALHKAARTGQGIDYAMLNAPLNRIEQAIQELRAELKRGPRGNIGPDIQRRAGRLFNHFQGKALIDVRPALRLVAKSR